MRYIMAYSNIPYRIIVFHYFHESKFRSDSSYSHIQAGLGIKEYPFGLIL
jgi:hypothetical protein